MLTAHVKRLSVDMKIWDDLSRNVMVHHNAGRGVHFSSLLYMKSSDIIPGFTKKPEINYLSFDNALELTAILIYVHITNVFLRSTSYTSQLHVRIYYPQSLLQRNPRRRDQPRIGGRVATEHKADFSPKFRSDRPEVIVGVSVVIEVEASCFVLVRRSSVVGVRV